MLDNPYTGSFSRGDETACFQIPCEMQQGLDVLHQITRKTETSGNEAIILEFGARMQQKENVVKADRK